MNRFRPTVDYRRCNQYSAKMPKKLFIALLLNINRLFDINYKCLCEQPRSEKNCKLHISTQTCPKAIEAEKLRHITQGEFLSSVQTWKQRDKNKGQEGEVNEHNADWRLKFISAGNRKKNIKAIYIKDNQPS